MKIRCVASALLAFSFASAAAQQRGAPIGIVQKVNGDWRHLAGGKPFKPTDFIFKGDVPTISRSVNARLIIGFFSSARVWDRNCTSATPCEGPYKLPDTVEPAGRLAYLQSYLPGEGSHTTPAIFAGARDATAGPEHAVLSADEHGMQMRATLSQFAAGTYKLTFTPVAPSKGTATTVNLVWDGDAATVPAIPPGFYALDAYSSDGDHIGSHAALLVVPSNDKDIQQRWEAAMIAIGNASGNDPLLAEKLRLATVLALRDGAIH